MGAGGFAHGFLTLSAVAEVQYKARHLEQGLGTPIRWDDAAGIQPLDLLAELGEPVGLGADAPLWIQPWQL